MQRAIKYRQFNIVQSNVSDIWNNMAHYPLYYKLGTLKFEDSWRVYEVYFNIFVGS